MMILLVVGVEGGRGRGGGTKHGVPRGGCTRFHPSRYGVWRVAYVKTILQVLTTESAEVIFSRLAPNPMMLPFQRYCLPFKSLL